MNVFSGQNDLSINNELLNLYECKLQLCSMMIFSGFEKLYFVYLARKFRMKFFFFSKLSHIPKHKREKKGIKKIALFVNSKISNNKKFSLDKLELCLLKIKIERRINLRCIERFLPEDKKRKFRKKIEGVIEILNILVNRWVSHKFLEIFFYKMKNMYIDIFKNQILILF